MTLRKDGCRHFCSRELLLMCLDCFSTRVKLLSLAGRLVMLLHWKGSGVNFTGGQGTQIIKAAWVWVLSPDELMWPLLSLPTICSSTHTLEWNWSVCEWKTRGSQIERTWVREGESYLTHVGTGLYFDSKCHKSKTKKTQKCFSLPVAHDIMSQICFEWNPFIAQCKRPVGESQGKIKQQPVFAL